MSGQGGRKRREERASGKLREEGGNVSTRRAARSSLAGPASVPSGTTSPGARGLGLHLFYVGNKKWVIPEGQRTRGGPCYLRKATSKRETCS